MDSIDRRSLLRTGLLAAGGTVLGACGGSRQPGFVSPTSPQVRAAETARRRGTVRDFQLTATQGTIDLGGRTVQTWTYGGRLPGAEIRVKAGEVVRARLANRLPAGTTIHWHGLTLRNDADGVPGVTQADITSGADHLYEFTTSYPGTYWFHPHAGTQLDRGLYAPLIVEDPNEPLSYDAEWVVILDDWLDGVIGSPEQVLAELRSSMPGMGMGAGSDLLGGNAGDVRYPYFLVNGRLADDPQTMRVKPGARMRIRFINAGGDTAFRVALDGHRMTVTHADGFPVRPASTDALLIGMGERYDVIVTVKSGAFPLTALAEGKNASARALLRTSQNTVAPPATARPRELDGEIIGYGDLVPADAVRLADRRPDRTIRLALTGGMMRYAWAINGRAYDPKVLYPVRSGERVRLSFVNTTMMWHPMHLHGHTFAVAPTGVRKDTAIVLPHRALEVDFDADNPGRWMIHCHNVYHAEAGMMTLLGYQA